MPARLSAACTAAIREVLARACPLPTRQAEEQSGCAYLRTAAIYTSRTWDAAGTLPVCFEAGAVV
jgi:hypothetical protein